MKRRRKESIEVLEERPGDGGCASTSGMARRYQPGLRRPTASSWGSVSASVCSGSSSSGSASLGPFWREPIRHDRKHRKKTPQVNADDAVDLWALDEVHFQQQGSRCRMWVPPETRDPNVYHHPTRKSVGYFAAVRLRDGEFLFRRETGRFNGESFWEFLKMFREASTVSGRRVLAISDNAQYHRSKFHLSWRDQQAPQFRLDFLPPYSRNSTLSNGSGSSRAGCVCTIVTSDSSMASFPPWKISLPNGQSPTISCADYAQLLRTLCLEDPTLIQQELDRRL